MSASRRLPFAIRFGILCGLLILVAAGCGERLRGNILDPNNPETGGGPRGFRALGGGSGVTLRWIAAPARADLLGFRLERRRLGPDDFEPIGDLLDLATTGTEDPTATWDLDYEYRLSFVTHDLSVSGTPVTRVARPGRETVWLTEPGLDLLVRLTPDGRERVLTVSGVRGVNRIAIDGAGGGDGAVWATEPFDGRIRVFSAIGAPIATFPGLTAPNAVAVHTNSRTAYVCDEVGGSVVRYDRSGTIQGKPFSFENPQDVATSSFGAWIVDATLETVTFVGTNEIVGPSVFVGGDPRRVAVDRLDGSIWVTCLGGNEVVHLSGNQVLSRTPLNTPFGIDIDEARNRVWVGLDLDNAVVALDRSSGAEIRRAGGIPRPRGVAVADRTGEVWVAAIASGEVVRLTSEGAVAGRTGGFDSPYDIRIDPESRAIP